MLGAPATAYLVSRETLVHPIGFARIALDDIVVTEVHDDMPVSIGTVSPGRHTLEATLFHQDGEPVQPPVTDEVSFEVR
jgi:hypothetical protein